MNLSVWESLWASDYFSLRQTLKHEVSGAGSKFGLFLLLDGSAKSLSFSLTRTKFWKALQLTSKRRMASTVASCFNSYKLFFFYIFICVCVCMREPQCVYEDQRITCRSWFSASIRDQARVHRFGGKHFYQLIVCLVSSCCAFFVFLFLKFHCYWVKLFYYTALLYFFIFSH